MKEPYLYHGLEAESYDLIDELADFDDYDFYRFLIEGNPGPTLDVGCGTGRILEPLARDGIEVVGLDFSEEMLSICRSKLKSGGSDATLVQGDMRHFELGQQFANVLIPGFSIQMLLDPEGWKHCLESCRKHLAPNGQLIVSTYMPWEMLESGLERKPLELRRQSGWNARGERVMAWQGWEIDRVEQLMTLLNRYRRVNKKGAVLEESSTSMTIRWLLPYEMQSLLVETGFSDISAYGDFLFEPPEANSETVVFVAGG